MCLSLILYTTNREAVVLVSVVLQGRIVDFVDVQRVRIVDVILRRTPEVRVGAAVVEVAIVEPAAGRQGGKPEGIGAVAIRFPTAC